MATVELIGSTTTSNNTTEIVSFTSIPTDQDYQQFELWISATRYNATASYDSDMWVQANATTGYSYSGFSANGANWNSPVRDGGYGQIGIIGNGAFQATQAFTDAGGDWVTGRSTARVLIAQGGEAIQKAGGSLTMPGVPRNTTSGYFESSAAFAPEENVLTTVNVKTGTGGEAWGQNSTFILYGIKDSNA